MYWFIVTMVRVRDKQSAKKLQKHKLYQKNQKKHKILKKNTRVGTTAALFHRYLLWKPN